MEAPKKVEENTATETKNPYELDFVTSSAISKVGLKFLIIYIPILWFAGMLTITAIMDIFRYVPIWILLPILPFVLFGMYYVFSFGVVFFSKLFLILINMIHRPKEGIFRAEKTDMDFEFWRLRIEIKKMGVWFFRNNPLPFSEAFAQRWFGLQMDFSSHLMDSWVDIEFVKLGHDCIVGQAAVLLSSMVVGNYLIIKQIVLDDYCVIGGMAAVAPGTHMEKDTLLGAASYTVCNQLLEEAYIYFGMPAKKLQPNKLAVSKIVKKDIDGDKRYEVKKEVNIDEDKKKLIKED